MDQKSSPDRNNNCKQAGQLRRESHDTFGDCDEDRKRVRRSQEFVDRDDDRERIPRSQARTSTFDRDSARNRAHLLRRGSHDNNLSIAMRIASNYIDRDESRERAGSVTTMFATNHASSNATRVARNSSMFDCKEGRSKQTTSSNVKTLTKPQAKQETCTFGLTEIDWFCESIPISLAEEVKKRNQQSTRL